MMVSKGVTLLAQTETFNNNIKEWRQKFTDLKTWAKFNNFFQTAHIEQLRAVTTTGKVRYTAAEKYIYCIPPSPHQNSTMNH